MEAKEKAEELFDKMYMTGIDEYDSKQCALIAVDELIKQQNNYNNGSFYPSTYWTEVKQEIEKL